MYCLGRSISVSVRKIPNPESYNIPGSFRQCEREEEDPGFRARLESPATRSLNFRPSPSLRRQGRPSPYTILSTRVQVLLSSCLRLPPIASASSSVSAFAEQRPLQ